MVRAAREAGNTARDAGVGQVAERGQGALPRRSFHRVSLVAGAGFERRPQARRCVAGPHRLRSPGDDGRVIELADPGDRLAPGSCAMATTDRPWPATRSGARPRVPCRDPRHGLGRPCPRVAGAAVTGRIHCAHWNSIRPGVLRLWGHRRCRANTWHRTNGGAPRRPFSPDHSRGAPVSFSSSCRASQAVEPPSIASSVMM